MKNNMSIRASQDNGITFDWSEPYELNNKERKRLIVRLERMINLTYMV